MEPVLRTTLDTLLLWAVCICAFGLWWVVPSPDAFFMILAAVAGVLYAGYTALRRRPASDFSEAEEYGNYRHPVSLWRDFFLIFLVVFVFRGFFYNWFSIPSNSMQPTLTVGDFVLVDRKKYGFRIPVLNARLSQGEDPQRGDVVVFHHPREGVIYIKRIMAVPGDSIAVYPDGVVINQVRLTMRADGTHQYTAPGSDYQRRVNKHYERLPDGGWHWILHNGNIRTVFNRPSDEEHCRLEYGGLVLYCVVPADKFFMLGDNRDNSNDSRFWGFVPRRNIIGLAQNIIFNRLSLFDFSALSRMGTSLLLQKTAGDAAAEDGDS